MGTCTWLQVSSSSGLLFFRSPLLQVFLSSGLLFRSPLQVSSSGLLFRSPLLRSLRSCAASSGHSCRHADHQRGPSPAPARVPARTPARVGRFLSRTLHSGSFYMLPFWSPCHAVSGTVFVFTLARFLPVLVELVGGGHFYNVGLAQNLGTVITFYWSVRLG